MRKGSCAFAHQRGISGESVAHDRNVEICVGLQVFGGFSGEHAVVPAEGPKKRIHVSRGKGTAGLFQTADCLYADLIAITQCIDLSAEFDQPFSSVFGLRDPLPQVFRLLPCIGQLLPALFLPAVKFRKPWSDPVRDLFCGGCPYCGGTRGGSAAPDLSLQVFAPLFFFEDLLLSPAKTSAEGAQGGVQILLLLPEFLQPADEGGIRVIPPASEKAIDAADSRQNGHGKKRKGYRMQCDQDEKEDRHCKTE